MSPSCRQTWSKNTKTSSKDCPWRSWSSCRKPWKGRSAKTATTALPLPPWPQSLEKWTTGLPPVTSWKETTQEKSLILLCDCSCQAFKACMAPSSDSLLLQKSLPGGIFLRSILYPTIHTTGRVLEGSMPTPSCPGSMRYVDTTTGLLVESACIWDFCFLSNSKFKAGNFRAPWDI